VSCLQPLSIYNTKHHIEVSTCEAIRVGVVDVSAVSHQRLCDRDRLRVFLLLLSRVHPPMSTGLPAALDAPLCSLTQVGTSCTRVVGGESGGVLVFDSGGCL
jgi:hypothetical protein